MQPPELHSRPGSSSPFSSALGLWSETHASSYGRTAADSRSTGVWVVLPKLPDCKHLCRSLGWGAEMGRQGQALRL